MIFNRFQLVENKSVSNGWKPLVLTLSLICTVKYSQVFHAFDWCIHSISQYIPNMWSSYWDFGIDFKRCIFEVKVQLCGGSKTNSHQSCWHENHCREKIFIQIEMISNFFIGYFVENYGWSKWLWKQGYDFSSGVMFFIAQLNSWGNLRHTIKAIVHTHCLLIHHFWKYILLSFQSCETGYADEVLAKFVFHYELI